MKSSNSGASQGSTELDEGFTRGVEAVLAGLSSAAFVVDNSNCVTVASPLARSFGLVAGDGVSHPELVALIDRTRSVGKVSVADMSLKRGPLGGVQLNLRVRVSSLAGSTVLVLAEDHSEAERVDRVRRDFLANISHELKTPLGAIGLLSEAIESAADDSTRVRRFAQQLSDEVHRLADLTQDVIALSRAQSSDALAGAKIVKVRKVVDEAVDRNRLAAQQASITVVTEFDGSPRVLGQRSQLVTSVHNLVQNAIQHSPEGSRVVVSARTVETTVEISVTDDGEGIEPDELDRIFERFYRVDDARSRHAGGSGIGLAIVKHSIQSHGGDVWARSRRGEGTAFVIRLAEAKTPHTHPRQKGA